MGWDFHLTPARIESSFRPVLDGLIARHHREAEVSDDLLVAHTAFGESRESNIRKCETCTSLQAAELALKDNERDDA